MARLGGDVGGLPAEVAAIINNTVTTGFMDQFPFRAELALGRSDLQWLRQFGRRFELEHLSALASSDSLSGKQAAVEELLRDFRTALASVASERASSNVALADRLADSTLLRDLRGGHRQWLSSLIDLACVAQLWGSEVLPARYRVLLSARDLNYLRQQSRKFSHAMGEGPYKGASESERRKAADQVRLEVKDYLSGRGE